MAENGVNGHQSNRNQWKVGLFNNADKYLTAETFGHKVNATGSQLKKKQVWCLEQEPKENCVYIKSMLGCYVSSDKYGKVTAEAEEAGDDEKFQVEYSTDGKWAFKHILRESYFIGMDDKVDCDGKFNDKKIWWSIQLYVHPQIHLRNISRKRYAHLNTEASEIQCTESVPWGSDAIIFLDFVGGKYTLRTCDNRYLSRDGTLQDSVGDDTMFCMEIHDGFLSFKDCEGRYLTAVGNKAVMKSRNSKASKDEYFKIEDSHPQIQMISPCIGKTAKSVSIKQGIDVSANQNTDEIEDTEIFQMECYSSGKWAFLTSTNKYWELQTGTGTVQAKSSEITPNCLFEVEWYDDGTVGIKGSDGKYLSNKQTGILYGSPNKVEADETNKFKVIIVNRPLLVLKSDFGFVGFGSKGSQFICNKAKYDILKVTSDGNGAYTIQGENQKYWNVGDDTMVYADDAPTKFQFQFCGGSMMAIRAPNGCYLKGEQNGNIKATATEIDASAKWEF